MNRNCNVIFGLFLAVAVLLSGCSMALTGSADIEQQAFTKEKKYALVTISASREFSGEQGLFQMFKDNDNIRGVNTQPVVDELVPVIRKKLARTGHFTSVPMKSIVNSSPYKRVEEDVKVRRVGIFSTEQNVGNGYKYLDDKQKLSQLARHLDVDGVICVNMDFSIVAMKSALSAAASNLLGGLPLSVGEKEYASSVAMSLTAYDPTGNLIWKDSTVKQAEPGDEKVIVLLDLSDLTDTNFEKMHPSAVLIGGYATDVLIERFQSTMEGKKTSIFQKTKDEGSKEATQKES